MPRTLSPSLQKFCEKVRVMNQTQSKNLILSSAEARNIESDIMELLLLITDLQGKLLSKQETIQVEIASPGFK